MQRKDEISMKTIYLQTVPTEKWAMVYQNDSLEQVLIERPEEKSLIGNIYKGRIVNIESSLQAAFVDFGQPKLGFLKKQEIPEARKDTSKPIERVVHEGQQVWVQVMKDAYDQKGAQLTANVTLPGRNLVYLPFGNYFAVSRKMTDEQRSHLKAWAGEACQSEEGLIFRTHSAEVSLEELERELGSLRERWTNLSKQYRNEKPPKTILEDFDIPDRLLRRFPEGDIESILVDNLDMKQRIQKRIPELGKKTKWVADIQNHMPFSAESISEKLLTRTITLDSGAQLVIDQTEAMVVMDVNTAKHTNTSNKKNSVLKTNQEAAKEAAKQIRLRNLSGMILIDFIDMKDEKDQERVVSYFKKQLRQDYVRTQIFGFTRLGILEMTRKREAPSLSSVLGKDHSQSTMMSRASEAYQLERMLLSYQSNDQDIIAIEAHPDVIEAFKERIDMKKLKSILYKDVYVLNNRESHVPFRIIHVGNVATLEERSFYKENVLDRLF
ncbi:hypothetical protein N783_05205 [Pontibacillus marinus BH030004 = DSM 16465]|uniref:S1 motif domain-containing protein n=2 Tax=Pontibacillus TaxID=289201 RepID=A0A0A5HHV9_9BACI|nr:hypothetical protein N783_05205 [Pontibacillus marinus BH030004 = DSM 16465]